MTGTGICRSDYGKTMDDRPVERLTLENGPGMRVGILADRGIINEISAPDRTHRSINVAHFSRLLRPQ